VKKLRNLTIENFQSHEHTSIDFDENFTVIVGASDQGKSAIIRALKWVLYNEPQGEEYIRVGATNVRVSLTLDDGTIIIRERGKKNRYILRQGEDERIFESFGRGVPEEILNAHGMIPIKLDEDHSLRLSLSEQLDGPFLLSESKPVKAKTIGLLSGVNIVDQAIRDITTDIRELMSEEKNIRENISRINDELSGFDDLDLMERVLPDIKNKYSEATAIKYRIDLLNSLKDKLNVKNEEIKLDMEIINALSTITVAGRKLSDAGMEFDRYNKLKGYYDRLQHINKRVSSLADVLDRMCGIENTFDRLKDANLLSGRLSKLKEHKTKLDMITGRLKGCEVKIDRLKTSDKATPALKEIEGIPSRLKRLKELHDRLFRIEKDLEKACKTEEEKRNEKEKWMSAYGQLLKRIGRCPVCGSEIDDHTVEKIIEELR